MTWVFVPTRGFPADRRACHRNNDTHDVGTKQTNKAKLLQQCSVALRRSTGTEKRRAGSAGGWRGMYDAADMRCATRQKDVQYIYSNEDEALQA